jgi:hypothetical protein
MLPLSRPLSDQHAASLMTFSVAGALLAATVVVATVLAGL